MKKTRRSPNTAYSKDTSSKTKKVKFSHQDKEITYDRTDAIKLYDDSSTVEDEDRIVEKKRLRGMKSETISVKSPTKIIQAFGIGNFDTFVEEGHETKNMSITELRHELATRNISTAGSKEELRMRLEEDLVKEGFQPSPEIDRKLKQKAAKQDDLDKWIQKSFELNSEQVVDPQRQTPQRGVKTYEYRKKKRL